MTQQQIKYAIEKNRRALMRIVVGWLITASLFKRTPNRVLPRRFGLWVSDLIFAAEKATYFLLVASRALRVGDAMPMLPPEPLTVGVAIMRLKAVKKSLIHLRDVTHRRAALRFKSAYIPTHIQVPTAKTSRLNFAIRSKEIAEFYLVKTGFD